VEKLSNAGFGADLLWRHLWGLASLKKAAGKKSSHWYAIPGLPPHTLRRFPDRVRRMADEIETVGKRIQSNEVYGLTAQLLPLFLAAAIPNAHIEFPISGEVLREIGTRKRAVPAALARGVLQRHGELPKLVELPKLLRLYADYIEIVSKLTAHDAPKGAALLNAMPLELIEAAKMLTGKPHWDVVATLLTAAYAAVGSNTIVDSKSLQMQHSRRSRKK
jgi:hypothetical protein